MQKSFVSATQYHIYLLWINAHLAFLKTSPLLWNFKLRECSFPALLPSHTRHQSVEQTVELGDNSFSARQPSVKPCHHQYWIVFRWFQAPIRKNLSGHIIMHLLSSSVLHWTTFNNTLSYRTLIQLTRNQINDTQDSLGHHIVKARTNKKWMINGWDKLLNILKDSINRSHLDFY